MVKLGGFRELLVLFYIFIFIYLWLAFKDLSLQLDLMALTWEVDWEGLKILRLTTIWLFFSWDLLAKIKRIYNSANLILQGGLVWVVWLKLQIIPMGPCCTWCSPSYRLTNLQTECGFRASVSKIWCHFACF